MKTVLTVAGSDSIGGAGVQADIKTVTMHGAYAASAITAVTAQNTLGVYEVYCLPEEIVAAQIKAVMEDIFPDAVKIGMTGNGGIVRVIAQTLKHYGAKNIVVDPVAFSTSGSALTDGEGAELTKRLLFPLASVITPNIPESEALAQMQIRGEADMKTAAEKLYRAYGGPFLIKGGHGAGADDVLCADGKIYVFRGERLDNPNTHGTGCTLSAAIAANLACGYGLCEAVERAKRYVAGTIGAKLCLGRGRGPLKHNFGLKSPFAAEAEDK